MADPFAERIITLTITTKTAAHKVAVLESEGVETLNAWYDFDRSASSCVKLIEHSTGVLSIDFKEVEAINAFVDKEAKRSFMDGLTM